MRLQDLGDALGLSKQQVSRLAKRGMPLDNIAAARKWRDAHLSTGHRKEYRFGHYEPRTKQQRHQAAVDAERALDGVQLLGVAAEQLVHAGQPLGALMPLLQNALRAVPPEHRDRIVFRGTDDEMLRLYGRTGGGAVDPEDVPFPIVVWHALLEPTLRIVKAEQEALGPPAPLTDDEAGEMADFWYGIAAGEFRVLPP